MFKRGEADVLMKMEPSDVLALAEKAKAGAPSDVRAYTLYSAWKAIQNDKGIPATKKARVFRTVCSCLEVQIANG